MPSILAFSGSNSSTSINQRLVEAAAEKVPSGSVTVISINDYPMPIYGIDREREGIPDETLALLERIHEADGFIISSPEHNGTVPAVFKNVVDWMSRVEKKVFGFKPTLLMSTSPGGGGGKTNLLHLAETLMPRWGADVCATFCMGNFGENYDAETESLVPDQDSLLTEAVDALLTRVDEKA